jgi:hypothetical protein
MGLGTARRIGTLATILKNGGKNDENSPIHGWSLCALGYLAAEEAGEDTENKNIN